MLNHVHIPAKDLTRAFDEFEHLTMVYRIVVIIEDAHLQETEKVLVRFPIAGPFRFRLGAVRPLPSALSM